jgi:hypothetical protein
LIPFECEKASQRRSFWTFCSRLHQLGFEGLEVTANPHAIVFYEHVGFVPDEIVDTAGYPAARMSRPTGAQLAIACAIRRQANWQSQRGSNPCPP